LENDLSDKSYLFFILDVIDLFRDRKKNFN
jgi:hypothetical protein